MAGRLMDSDRAEIHRSRHNPNELHLGPADDCHSCGTEAPTDQADHDLGLGVIVGALVCLGAWVLFALWWWS